MPPVPLAQLRARIAALEGRACKVPTRHPRASGDDEDPSDGLPWERMAAGGLHEIAAENVGGGIDHGATRGFAAFWLGRLAARRDGPLLWTTAADDLYAPGLAALGLPVHRLVVVSPARSAEVPRVLEEALRCPAVAAVAGELWDLSMVAGRRLSLAARASGVPALLLNRGAAVGSAVTRWRVGPAPSSHLPAFAVETGRWRAALIRCRGRITGDDGMVAEWLVAANDAAGDVAGTAVSHVPGGMMVSHSQRA